MHVTLEPSTDQPSAAPSRAPVWPTLRRWIGDVLFWFGLFLLTAWLYFDVYSKLHKRTHGPPRGAFMWVVPAEFELLNRTGRPVILESARLGDYVTRPGERWLPPWHADGRQPDAPPPVVLRLPLMERSTDIELRLRDPETGARWIVRAPAGLSRGFPCRSHVEFRDEPVGVRTCTQPDWMSFD